MSEKVAATIVISILAVVFVVNAYFWVKLSSYLKKVHPGEWEKIGKPDFLNQSISNGVRTMSYLVTEEYKAVGDSYLNSLAGAVRISTFVLWGIMLFVFAVKIAYGLFWAR